MIVIPLSFGLVAASIYYSKFVFTSTVPMTLNLSDSQYFDGSENERHLCWINPDAGGTDAIKNILANYPEKCSFIGSKMIVNTYVGHQFAIVENFVQYNATVQPKVLTALVNSPNVDAANIVEYDPLASFDYVVEWQRLILLRRQIATTVACVLLAITLLTNVYPREQSKKLRKVKKVANSEVEVQPTLLARNVIKGYAVVTMLLNHIGHIFIPRTSFVKPMFTILADAGGSMHLFNWLVGYNLTATSRSSEVRLLGVFVFLQFFVYLPPPVTYETLLSISVIRWVLNTAYCKVDVSTGRSKWADATILMHAVTIMTIIFLDNITGAEGLKMIPGNGLLFAASGRLFAMQNVDPYKRYLWVTTSAVYTLFSMRYNLLTLFRDFPLYQYMYGTAFVLLTLMHTLIVNWRLCGGWKGYSWSPPPFVSTIATFLSRFSLEIYFGHFVVFTIIHDYVL